MKSSFVKLRRPRGLDGPRKAIQASLLAGSLLMASLLGSSLIGRAAVVSAAPVVAAGPLLGVNDAEPGAAAATLPFGGVWLPDALGGHFWLAEGTLGFCRLDPAPTAANPDRMLQTNCGADAKLLSPAQATYDPNPIPFAAQIGVPAGAHWLYIADSASKSTWVTRLPFDPATGTVIVNKATTQIPVDPGVNAPRPASLARDDQGNLFVGFIRSPAIFKITNPGAQTPTAGVVIGSDADGRKGVKFGLAFVAGGLYTAELGGGGVGVIPDVNGNPARGRPACTPTRQCLATFVAGITTQFPQGMTSDGTYLYVGDAPRVGPATVLRYDPFTDTQDVYSTLHQTTTFTYTDTTVTPAVTSTVTSTRYTNISGLGLGADGSLFVGDDQTLGLVVGTGHLWKIAAGVTPEIAGAPGAPAIPPPPAGVTIGNLFSWGQTAPKGGSVFLPNSSGSGHIWVPDHVQGLCRLDTVRSPVELGAPLPAGTVQAALNLRAVNNNVCDDATAGSQGQAAYDPTPNPDGTHFVYVGQNDRFSPGVWRYRFDPVNEVLQPAPELMCPTCGLDSEKANGIALGPDGALYVGGLADGVIRRVNNPRSDPRAQILDDVYITQDARGINGTMGFIGADLYLPENNTVTVVKNAPTACPILNGDGTRTPCHFDLGKSGIPTNIPDNTINIPLVFASGVAVDPTRGAAGTVYASYSPGAAFATLFKYDVATGKSVVYATRGKLPAVGTPETTVWCTLTCNRPTDPTLDLGADPTTGVAHTYGFRFAMGLFVDVRDGTLYVADDPTAGARGQRGHLTAVPYCDSLAIGTPCNPAPPAAPVL